MEDICFASARSLAAQLRARTVSAREVMQSYLGQIARLNPTLNAIVARLDDEQCLAMADDADRKMAAGESLPPLHGLPIAFKDLEPARGFPYTQGSRIFRGLKPAADSLLVERLRLAGAIPIGKTNVPEFGLGSHTYNEVYGATRNPYNPEKTAGGSSGGAGAALAAGMLPIADGSDYGGSLRNPANFNNIVALRPTVGLVPTAPTPFPWLGFSVKGPMGRSVTDVAWLLSVMAGADDRDPSCVPSEPQRFAGDLARAFAGVRVAWCPDLGGLPLDPAVRAVLDSRRALFEAFGCHVEEACPDFAGVDELFRTIRAWRNAAVLGPLVDRYPELVKPEAVEEVRRGRRVTGALLAQAMMAHTELLERIRRFQEQYEFLVCAVNQVPPFDVSQPWPRSVDGEAMDDYLGWMRSAYWISATFRPAASVPAGFTADGLPVGIQLVGRYRDDRGVLQLAYAFEQATECGRRRPPVAVTS